MNIKLVGVTKTGQLYLYRKDEASTGPPIQLTDMAVIIQDGYLYPPRLTFQQMLKQDSGWKDPIVEDLPPRDIETLVEVVDKAEKRLNLATMQLEDL